MPDDLAHLLVEEMLAFIRPYAELSSSKIFNEPDCYAFETKIDFPVFNGVPFINFTSETADRRIEELRKKLVGRAISWKVHSHSQPTDLRDRLIKSGAEQIVELCGMAMQMNELATAPDVPSNVTIKPAQTDQEVKDYATVFPMLFDSPTEPWLDALIDAELEIFHSGKDPFHRWIAYENGQAIAAGMTMQLGITAALQTLSTLEQARNRGIGRALATQALLAEKERGCTRAALWSSPGAQSLYERMGFKPCATAQVLVG